MQYNFYPPSYLFWSNNSGQLSAVVINTLQKNIEKYFPELKTKHIEHNYSELYIYYNNDRIFNISLDNEKIFKIGRVESIGVYKNISSFKISEGFKSSIMIYDHVFSVLNKFIIDKANIIRSDVEIENIINIITNRKSIFLRDFYEMISNKISYCNFNNNTNSIYIFAVPKHKYYNFSKIFGPFALIEINEKMEVIYNKITKKGLKFAQYVSEVKSFGLLSKCDINDIVNIISNDIIELNIQENTETGDTLYERTKYINISY